jgi:hypothetical protein
MQKVPKLMHTVVLTKKTPYTFTCKVDKNMVVIQAKTKSYKNGLRLLK